MKNKEKKQNVVTILIAFIILTAATFAISAFREMILYNPIETSFPLKDIIILKSIPYILVIVLMIAATLFYYFHKPKKKK